MARLSDTVNGYLATLDRLEPDIYAIDSSAALASMAISLRRIANALEAQNSMLTDADDTETVDESPVSGH